ncbi:hypothetical protein JCM11641_008231 [Rhodosporidiobolus odoratus]
MPSIKSCLASIALAAFAFAPISAAATTSHGVAARGVNSESSGIARREAAAKALAKRARKTTSKSAGTSANPYSKDSAFLNTKAAKAAARIRCGTNNVCERRAAAAPANGAALCVTGKCTYRCLDGYAPGGADGTECVASATTCNGQTCNVPENGYATCDADTGNCSLGCNTPYILWSGDGGVYQECFATQTDAANCGTPSNVCPSSYNGIGTPSCKAGNCRIVCPAGYFVRRAQSTTNPYYCYNGESSLVRNN